MAVLAVGVGVEVVATAVAAAVVGAGAGIGVRGRAGRKGPEGTRRNDTIRSQMAEGAALPRVQPRGTSMKH